MNKSNKYLIFFFFLFLTTFLYSGIENYRIEDVMKIKRMIEKIKLSEPQNEIRKEVVHQNEVNSYLNFRIKEENLKNLKEIKVKIFKNNIIEGKIVIDLKNKDEEDNSLLNVYFRGKIIVNENKAKIDFQKLFLEEQQIPVNFLELIVNYLSKIEGYEPLSIFSWYELPYGIKDVKTKEKQILIYY